MSKMIQLRNVPESLHRKLEARAAMEGMSLSDCLLSEIRHIAEKPTLNELRARLNQHAPVELNGGGAEILRAERDSR